MNYGSVSDIERNFHTGQTKKLKIKNVCRKNGQINGTHVKNIFRKLVNIRVIKK